MSKRKVRWPALRSVLGPILSCFLPGLFSQSKIILFLRLYWCKLIWQIPTTVAFPCSIVRVISPLLCLFKNPFKSVSFLARTRCFAFSRILRHNVDHESSPRSRIIPMRKKLSLLQIHIWRTNFIHIQLYRRNQTYHSKNVIYMIHCNHCSKQYIGETKRRLKDRFNEHRRPVDNPSNISKPTTVSEHFLTNDHSANDIILIPLELIKSNRDSVRKAREAYLIERGNTLKPLGMNKKDEM